MQNAVLRERRFHSISIDTFDAKAFQQEFH